MAAHVQTPLLVSNHLKLRSHPRGPLQNDTQKREIVFLCGNLQGKNLQYFSNMLQPAKITTRMINSIGTTLSPFLGLTLGDKAMQISIFVISRCEPKSLDVKTYYKHPKTTVAF